MSIRLTLLFLLVVIALIVGALLYEASRGPTFRAADHADLAECLRAIPREWLPGSLEHDGAAAACRYVHGRPSPAQP